jgi:hypothetical protein
MSAAYGDTLPPYMALTVRSAQKEVRSCFRSHFANLNQVIMTTVPKVFDYFREGRSETSAGCSVTDLTVMDELYRLVRVTEVTGARWGADNSYFDRNRLK